MTLTTQEENYMSDKNQVSIPKFLRGLAVHSCGCSCDCQIYDGTVGRKFVTVVKKEAIMASVGMSQQALKMEMSHMTTHLAKTTNRKDSKISLTIWTVRLFDKSIIKAFTLTGGAFCFAFLQAKSISLQDFLHNPSGRAYNSATKNKKGFS